jgi:hypothetical protein
MNMDQLRQLYASSSAARCFLDYFASRERNASTTKIDRLLQVAQEREEPVGRPEAIEFLRRLEDIVCGRYVEGRRGHPSRFAWDVSLIEVGQAASGNSIKVSLLNDDETEASVDSRVAMLPHDYRLRADLIVRFSLPANLTGAEAHRLAEFIKTLPFE